MDKASQHESPRGAPSAQGTAFAAALSDATAPRWAHAWDDAVAQWEPIALEPIEFAQYVDARVGAVSEPSQPRTSPHISDLYIACACVLGHPRAAAAFCRVFTPGIEATLSTVRGIANEADEIQQRVLFDLLTTTDHGPPKIGNYRGHGPIGAWLRVVTVRAAHRHSRRAPREQLGHDALLHQTEAPDAGGELAYLKQLYRQEYKQAFEEAVVALGRRERNLLRYRFLEGLSIDQIGAIYHLHRSTAARQLRQAEASLREGVRARLATRLRVDPSLLRSITRLIQSDLDVSLPRVLQRSPSG